MSSMRQQKEASCFGGMDHCPLSQGFMALFSECALQALGRWALRRTPAPRNARPEDARSSAFSPSEAPSRPERSDAPPAFHRASSVWWPLACGGPAPPPSPLGRTSGAPERPSSGLSPEHRQSWCRARRRLFFYNVTPTPEIYTLSLHDALPI